MKSGTVMRRPQYEKLMTVRNAPKMMMILKKKGDPKLKARKGEDDLEKAMPPSEGFSMITVLKNCGISFI